MGRVYARVARVEAEGRLKMHECPKCGTPMEQQEDEPDVGVVGGWYCGACDYGELGDIDDEPDFHRD